MKYPKSIFIVRFLIFLYVFLSLNETCMAFSSSGLRWATANVSYFLKATPNQSVINAHKSSANTWSTAGSNFTFSYAGIAPDDRIPGVFDDVNTIGGRTPADYPSFGPDDLAITATKWELRNSKKTMLECDMVMNLSKPISTAGDPNAYDIETISLHEFGHFLHLDHVPDPNSIMYEFIGLGDIQRGLDTDSRNGIISIYGPK